MITIVGIGFFAVFLLCAVGVYYWLFGASKINENDGRP
jgi:cbb3-type cytochrome oxidase subunit 3